MKIINKGIKQNLNPADSSTTYQHHNVDLINSRPKGKTLLNTDKGHLLGTKSVSNLFNKTRPEELTDVLHKERKVTLIGNQMKKSEILGITRQRPGPSSR